MLPPRVAFLMCMLFILQRRQCSGQGSMGDDNYGDTGLHTMDHTEYTCASCIIGKSIPFLCSECVSEQSQGQFTCGRCSLLREFFHCRRCRAKNPDIGDNFSVHYIMEIYNFYQLLFRTSQKWKSNSDQDSCSNNCCYCCYYSMSIYSSSRDCIRPGYKTKKCWRSSCMH